MIDKDTPIDENLFIKQFILPKGFSSYHAPEYTGIILKYCLNKIDKHGGVIEPFTVAIPIRNDRRLGLDLAGIMLEFSVGENVWNDFEHKYKERISNASST
jgi:hypothetical protein